MINFAEILSGLGIYTLSASLLDIDPSLIAQSLSLKGTYTESF
jgi:hypothetical protein